MSQKDKLIDRFVTIPSDFTFAETVTLLKIYGFDLRKNDGSRRSFVNPQTLDIIHVHEPHPGNIMKKYALRDIKVQLEEKGYL